MSTAEDAEILPGTIDDLVADAKALGVEIKQRLVTDWVSRGLLDNPEHRGAGQGMGSLKATFSANQRELFRLLINKRAEVPRLSWLSSLPLVLWAYWGDDYVPTRQARKALMTSLDSREQPKERARVKAREMVAALRHEDANSTDCNRLYRLFFNALVSGRVADANDLYATFVRVFDPHGANRRLLPPGIDMGISASPANVVGAAVRQQLAIAAFVHGQVTDDDLDQARRELQITFVEYAERNPLLYALSGQRLVTVALHHEFQNLMDGIVQNTWLVLGAVLDQPGKKLPKPRPPRPAKKSR